MAADAALVTGGSRGIGAETCVALAEAGYDVAFTYRNKTARADQVARRVREAGRRALAVMADITDRDRLVALADEVRAWATRLDALVLNASGGLERDLLAADPTYPTRINRDAQLDTLDAVGPLLVSGGTVVHVTSHWAHRYGEVEQMPAYEPIAESKHAGEAALRARLGELAARGIRLIVVTGGLVEGTITPKLLARASPAFSAMSRSGHDAMTSTLEMARAITRAIEDRSLPTGHTVVVGGPLDSLG